MSHPQYATQRPALERRPRVLVVGPLYPQGGGVGTVDYTLLHCDLTRGFEMRLLDTGRGRRGHGKEGQLAPINIYYFARQAARLLTILVTWRPVIVHQSLTDSAAFWKESALMLLARALGAQVVAHVHGNRLETQYREAGRRKRRLMRAALGIPQILLVLSEHTRAFLAETVSPAAGLVVVPNSIDPQVAEAMERVEQEPSHKECLVLFMGGVGKRKGVLDALRAAPLVRQKVPGVHFVFAGPLEEPERVEVEPACRAAERDGLASFPGLVTGPQKLDLLRRASIFILPSYHENFPVAILEAMALGLPIVSTSVAGIPDIVEDGRHGFLIRPGDHVALAERVVRLAGDPALRRTMGQVNQARVRQEYHPRLFAARIASLYRQMLVINDLSLGQPITREP